MIVSLLLSLFTHPLVIFRFIILWWLTSLKFQAFHHTDIIWQKKTNAWIICATIMVLLSCTSRFVVFWSNCIKTWQSTLVLH